MHLTKKAAASAKRAEKTARREAALEEIKRKIFLAILLKEKIREIRLKGGRIYKSVGIVDYCHGDVFAFTARNDGFDFKLVDITRIIP